MALESASKPQEREIMDGAYSSPDELDLIKKAHVCMVVRFQKLQA